MTKEQKLILSVASKIISPWEELNKELSKHYSVSLKTIADNGNL